MHFRMLFVCFVCVLHIFVYTFSEFFCVFLLGVCCVDFANVVWWQRAVVCICSCGRFSAPPSERLCAHCVVAEGVDLHMFLHALSAPPSERLCEHGVVAESVQLCLFFDAVSGAPVR